MSGGSFEYVMGVYNNIIRYSGFSSLPDSKYYNNYTGTSYTGHALTETARWYSDFASFVESSPSWFMRGGRYSDSADAGVFSFSGSGGSSADVVSSRLVISNE